MKSLNFNHLKNHDPLFLQLATQAESLFVVYPNTTLLILRQLGEAIAQDIASRLGIEFEDNITQIDLLKQIQDKTDFEAEIIDTFHNIRKIGNEASHNFISNHREAKKVLRLSWQLTLWYHRTFGNPAKNWKSGAFKTPEDPSNKVRELEEQIANLTKEQQTSKQKLVIAEQLAATEKQKTAELIKYNQYIEAEKATWQALAEDSEQETINTKKQFQQFQQHRHKITQQANPETTKQAIKKTPWQETEAETRIRIDQQLRDAGWQVDTENLRYSKGSRPMRGENLAIAEWPTESGPADYVLFIGLTAYATVEAKKTSNNVSSAIEQAERYSKNITSTNGCEFLNGSPWQASNMDTSKGCYNVPFVFATNGRRYLKQNEQSSGIWFRDLRNPHNHGKVNDGWYSPEELQALYKQDIPTADSQLAEQGFNYDIALRDYQINAIKVIEQAISKQQQNILVAMATGTGKTITSIALMYRLLQAQRFRRILFLVDRTALGEQTANAFETTKMLNQHTFADSYNIKKLTEIEINPETQVHIATIQGMLKRVLLAETQPTVGQYDCIIVDECHRGYLLDKELADNEIEFRSEADYISKYRRVIDYFDAVKIGLTATPALHTSEIFGNPVFTYTYREAVVDGFLIDHEPPIRIQTEHNLHGINYKTGEQILFHDQQQQNIKQIELADDLKFDIKKINKQIIAESFNQTVCEVLAKNIDPCSKGKTLIFCVNNRHADEVVRLLKIAFKAEYGECEDAMICKITCSIDKPQEKIRQYKNERLPNIVVTVDLLTTGIDVPEICNLVFLRPVTSRILYEQMKGRATRLCQQINKECFRIFDAVSLYDNLEPVTNMKMVVVKPNISFTQLIEELTNPEITTTDKQQICEQFITKLQRKKNSINNDTNLADSFTTATDNLMPEEFIQQIKNQPLDATINWFIDHPEFATILDSQAEHRPAPLFISDKQDNLIKVSADYGNAITPEDYLVEFTNFIKNHINDIVAINTLVHQPANLSRKQIKEIQLLLDRKNFTEKNLKHAWQLKTKKSITARIVGYIRQAALGEALIAWEQRVDNAIAKILQGQKWNIQQKNILQMIANLLKQRLALDEESINASSLKDQYGSYNRINTKVFNNKLPELLKSINNAIWQVAEQQA